MTPLPPTTRAGTPVIPTTLTLQLTRLAATYYYRLRACNTNPAGTACSDWRVGTNPIVVTR